MELTLEQIPLLATKFHPLIFDPNATRSEVFGGAFAWSDEQPDFENVEGAISISLFFQYLLWYRRSLIEKNAFKKFTPYWSALQQTCPTWPGFRPERSNPELLIELENETNKSMRALDRFLASRKNNQKRQTDNDCSALSDLVIMENQPSKTGAYHSRQRPADYLAELRFVPNRTAWYTSHSNLTYDWESLNDGLYHHLEFTDRNQAFPGDTVKARMWLLAPNIQIGKLTIGMKFEIFLPENTKVGTGEILKIFNPCLESNQNLMG